ncbi:MAG: VOC family protein [Hyphomonadaceae bacterium]
MSDKVHAVGLAVGDLTRSVAFYTQVFGLTQYETYDLPHMREILLGYAGDQFRVVLMQYTDGERRDPRVVGNKLVFEVRDAFAIADRLREAGAEITREPSAIGGFAAVAFALDPDGHTLELLQR